MKLRNISLFVLILLLLSGTVFAKKIEVKGKIINATSKEEESVSDHTVQLAHYSTEKSKKGELKVEDSENFDQNTDKNGKFSFKDLKVKTGDFLVLMTHYQGAHYEKNIEVSEDTDSYSVDFKVYETTDKKENIRVASHHVMYAPQGDSVEVTEFLQMKNTGKKTYTGTPIEGKDFREVLRFSLPKGYEQIELASGFVPEKAYQSETYIVETSSLKPGMKQFRFTYLLPLDKPFLQTIAYPTDSYSIILENTKSNVEIDDFTPVNLTEGTSKSVKAPYFKGKNLEPGQRVGLRYAGVDSYLNKPVVWIIGVGVVFLIVVISLRFFGKDAEELNDLNQQKERLLDEIATLDDNYEKGEIEEEKYRELRENKKEKLVEITKKINNTR